MLAGVEEMLGKVKGLRRQVVASGCDGWMLRLICGAVVDIGRGW
jgi:hypothetical protein